MAKLLLVLGLILSIHSQARTPCTFQRILHVEVTGLELPLELKNKILNALDAEKIFAIKENKDMGIKVCVSFVALKDPSEVISRGAADKVEHLLVKVDFSKQNLFWMVKMESFIRPGSKELVSVASLNSLKAPKPISELKNVEAADWVQLKLFEISKK